MTIFNASLIGSFAIPICGLGIVLSYIIAIFVHLPEATLRCRITVNGLRFEGDDFLWSLNWEALG